MSQQTYLNYQYFMKIRYDVSDFLSDKKIHYFIVI